MEQDGQPDSLIDPAESCELPGHPPPISTASRTPVTVAVAPSSLHLSPSSNATTDFRSSSTTLSAPRPDFCSSFSFPSHPPLHVFRRHSKSLHRPPSGLGSRPISCLRPPQPP